MIIQFYIHAIRGTPSVKAQAAFYGKATQPTQPKEGLQVQLNHRVARLASAA